jgi:hypothetical protein
LDAVLEAGLVAHLGVNTGGWPMVVPTMYGFTADTLYLHGSVASQSLNAAGPVCVTITLTDGRGERRAALPRAEPGAGERRTRRRKRRLEAFGRENCHSNAACAPRARRVRAPDPRGRAHRRRAGHPHRRPIPLGTLGLPPWRCSGGRHHTPQEASR